MKKWHMALTDPTEWISYPLLSTNGCYQRQLLLITGETTWCIDKAISIVSGLAGQLDYCWISDVAPAMTLEHRSYAHFKDLLGKEFDVAVVDAGETFRPSVLAAIAGTVRQGGTTILLCPPLETWAMHESVLNPHFLSHGSDIHKSHYISYLADLLVHADFAGRITSTAEILPMPQEVKNKGLTGGLSLTPDQQDIFNAITSENVNKQSCRCIVAARGRGKSTLAGHIAAHFINAGRSVMLSAPSLLSVKTLERVAESLIKDTALSLEWMALDNPKLREANYDVLIIDEAASVPLPVLNELIDRPRLTLLSTTTDGYEGSGQGFRTKFLKHRNIPVYTLRRPIRWSKNDPLEKLINALIFASPEQRSLPDAVDSANFTKDKSEEFANGDGTTEYKIYKVSEMDLCLAKEVMQLLSTAHYQSSPDDLARMMDSPDLQFHLLFADDSLMAASAVEVEGGKRLADVASGIASGTRRVKGHLTAQSLALQSAQANVATLHYRRINRIAVQPRWQGYGLGSELLSNLKHYYQHVEKIDLLTTSFGADAPLLNFWTSADFLLIKRGRKPDKASGFTSALMALPFSDTAENAITKLIDCERNPENPIAMPLHQRRLEQFAGGSRSVDHLYSSSNWLLSRCDDAILCLCLSLLEQSVNPAKVAQDTGYNGKKTMIADCRRRVSEWLESIASH